MRVAVAALAGVSALLVAGCGSQGVVLPTANGVSGTLTRPTTTALAKGDPAAGKKLFASEGCTGCHTFAPAGSHGKIGPDLDKLAQYAKQANQGPLQQFVETSITTPGAYIQPGFQNVMPTTYANLPAKQIADLVAFLTQKQ
ncbi:MAG: cytochrome c [Actinobacteria bacterium]|nr:MAG: cytochrome c [Actinomycetota bacterium]